MNLCFRRSVLRSSSLRLSRVSSAKTAAISKPFLTAGNVTIRGLTSMPKSLRDFEHKDLVSLQISSCKKFADRNLFGTKQDGASFEWTTFAEFDAEVQQFRKVLKKLEIGVDDKVALISNNRREWAVAYFGVLGVGAQIVPMYEAQQEKEWKYIVDDSDAKLVIVANDKIYEKTAKFTNGGTKCCKSVIAFDTNPDYLHSFAHWMKLVEKDPDFPALIPSDPSSQLATIIYTSGTTGNPKGVELTHTNIISNIAALEVLWQKELSNNHISVCFLPWAHVFGQVCELHALLGGGGCMAIAPNREALVECIGIVKPTMMASVPVLFNKVYDNVMKNVSEQSPFKQKMFKLALAIARRRNNKLEFGKPVSSLLNLEHSIMDKIVLSKIRERLGGRLKYFASGGAATSLPVVQFFEDIGVPICEGYGLTETSPVIASGSRGWATRRLGCVGVPLDGVTVKIMDPETMEEVSGPDLDGEVCVSGPNVMRGYRNNPAANAEVFFTCKKDGERYFKTGDLGRMVEGKFLKITGRIKEQYKLENGKYVVPGPLEDVICRSHFIHQALLFGDNKPFNIVLIVPDMVQLRAWVAKHVPSVPFSGSSPENDREMINLRQVQELISMEIFSAIGPMKGYEKPQKWAVIMDPFTPENQMLTPKMSMRRTVIIKTYSQLIKDIYDEKEGITVNSSQIAPA